MNSKWWNPAKLYKKKAPKKGREKETRGKDWSPGKKAAQIRCATRGNGTINNQTLLQSHEAYQLKKGEVKFQAQKNRPLQWQPVSR